PSSSIPSDEFAGGSDVPVGATTGPSADPSNKGKSPMVEEDPLVRERTFRQREEDRLGEEAARRLYKEEQDALEREREEMQRKRQQDVLNSAKYYIDSNWTDIMGQVHANQGLTADLLGLDVNEDNFAKRMTALIAKRRRDFAAQRAAIVDLKSQNIRRSLKRPGADLAQASSKKSKPPEASKSFVPDESQQPSAEVPPTVTQQPSEFSSPPTILSAEPRTHSYGTRRKSLRARKKQLGQKGVHTSHSTIPIENGDPEAEHKMCIKYASDADSASDDDTPINLYDVVDWEVLSTGLRLINAFYRKDNSHNQAEGVGLVLWGDLKVLIDSPKVNDVDGLVLHMFVDKKYPLSVNLIERMLDHQLEICQGTMVMKAAFAFGFKMLLFNPLAFSRKDLSRNLKLTVVKVPAGRYVVPAGKDNVIVSTGRTKVIPAGRTILVLLVSAKDMHEIS
ncbi:hypothetical protein Tco_0885774, partial [Tanacetum coccineum]